LKALNAAIKAGGANSYLEVVSLDRQSEIVSAKAAAEIGVDVLLGGTRVDDVLPIIKGSGIQYFPFAGRITGHPSVLEGTIEEIVESAKSIAAKDGVHGLDLLAYRSVENVPDLMKAVCAAVCKPVFMAGSIDTRERIAIVQGAGAAGFTIGTAALDGKYPANGTDVPSQLNAIIRDVAALNKHLSPIRKKNLSTAFTGKVEAQVNDMQLKVAKFEGASRWSFRQHDDELFFVHRGRLLMKFRDREEIVEPGEFIVVPHGVEHCAVALDGEACEVLSATTTAPCQALANAACGAALVAANRPML
jgi:mannose-6-phosphate isomerase-like protein (cupin superfamily)